ncbi:MAG TPA: hypothetical protein VHM70_32165 [Polyangiaceae bacterium]|jgi:hypothetical protein|nr:hypothetical protein [Polyangiaceae bacterium]
MLSRRIVNVIVCMGMASSLQACLKPTTCEDTLSCDSGAGVRVDAGGSSVIASVDGNEDAARARSNVNGLDAGDKSSIPGWPNDERELDASRLGAGHGDDASETRGLVTADAPDAGQPKGAGSNDDGVRTTLGDQEANLDASTVLDGEVPDPWGDDSSDPNSGVVIESDGGPDAPSGVCLASPLAPGHGTFAECGGTPSGGACELTCDSFYVGEPSRCAGGAWSAVECRPLGKLNLALTNATDGSPLVGAMAYVAAHFDPAGDVCDKAHYCVLSDGQGNATFDAFPTDVQTLTVTETDFEEINASLEVSPASTASVHWEMLPANLLENDIGVVLNWHVPRDLDLLLSVPYEVEGMQCVYHGNKGGLDTAPYASLAADTKYDPQGGTELVRIGLSEGGVAPHYAGTYSLVVHTMSSDGLLSALPTVRVVRRGSDGVADVTQYEMPAMSENANIWHVFNLDENGALMVVGNTEYNYDNPSDIPCADLANEL